MVSSLWFTHKTHRKAFSCCFEVFLWVINHLKYLVDLCTYVFECLNMIQLIPLCYPWLSTLYHELAEKFGSIFTQKGDYRKLFVNVMMDHFLKTSSPASQWQAVSVMSCSYSWRREISRFFLPYFQTVLHYHNVSLILGPALALFLFSLDLIWTWLFEPDYDNS